MRSCRFLWDQAGRSREADATQSARTPGDVAPIANQGQNQKQYGDNQNAGGLQMVDRQLGVCFGGTVGRLPLWLGGGHNDIVAPELEGGEPRER